MWEWYHRMKDEFLDFNKEMDDSIVVFQEILYLTNGTEREMDERDTWPTHYYQLNCNQLWLIVLEILKVTVGVSEYMLPTMSTREEIRGEVDKVKRALLWWAFAENLEQTQFGDIDYVMIDDKNRSMNQHFRYRVYYIIREFDGAIERLNTVLDRMKHGEVRDMHAIDRNASRIGNYDIALKYVRELVRLSAADDADEFILYAIADYQNEMMNENHEKICQLVRFQKFQTAEFDEKLPPGQIWATLFMDVFDGKDEVLEIFMQHFANIAILYFMKDYTGTTFGIEQIPWYGVYSDDNGETYTSDLHCIIDKPKIDSRIKSIVKSYENS